MINLRSLLQDGKTIVGTWCNSGSPIIAELLAQCEFDFVCVDVEHSAVDLSQVQHLFQAITSGRAGCAPLVRLHGVDYAHVKRYVDAGARGVVCPLITNADEARLLVRATKYPPLGRRGVGFCRANKFGMNLQREFEQANDELLTVVQIEHIDAVANLDDIFSVEGIDAAFIGPYDLSASMNLAGRFDHPEYLRVRQTILEACVRHDIVPGIHVVEPDPAQLLQRVNEGYRLLAYSLDITMLMHVSSMGINAVKKHLRDDNRDT